MAQLGLESTVIDADARARTSALFKERGIVIAFPQRVLWYGAKAQNGTAANVEERMDR